MSKDHHYIYPEGRCTEPKIRETIRLISDVKNSVCSEGGKAERNVEFKEQIQCILGGIFQFPVVPKVDSAIQQINLYPVDSAIGFPNTYPLARDLSGG